MPEIPFEQEGQVDTSGIGVNPNDSSRRYKSTDPDHPPVDQPLDATVPLQEAKAERALQKSQLNTTDTEAPQDEFDEPRAYDQS